MHTLVSFCRKFINIKAFIIGAFALIVTARPALRGFFDGGLAVNDRQILMGSSGDSYTSSEFNTSGVQPSLSQPFGNPSVGTSPDDLLGNPQTTAQTTANGPIWPMHLSVVYNTTTTLLYDFAVSGASIPDGYTIEILNEYEPQYASQFGQGSAQWNGNNSIFASWISINDINWCSSLFSSAPSNFSACLPPRLDMYFDLMASLYDSGARNYFFVNMPPLSRAPMVTQNGQDIIDNYREGVSLFNEKLFPEYVQTFTSTYNDVRTVIYDAFSLFSEILDNPTGYGFKDNSSYTCIGCTNGTRDF
ncbi:carbohydrate esterase family 16 protein [Oidiodendron maius Zn]|uniref:Carbohydrate esterase family 16 protein n=1 Tax=Oidiodendron maius (strain Zn) TaxID=913774 RepID=A0A0C3HZM6_OIDMZ|nr:carbohydrate esterase family 16 protein [Oidiodendron maius Zn]